MLPVLLGLLFLFAIPVPSAGVARDASAAPGTAVLDCRGPIGARVPDRSMTRVSGAVALATRSSTRLALGTSPITQPAAPFVRYFAKSGLMVRTTGPGATLVIPAAWRGRVAISWGNTEHDVVATESLSVGPCPGPSDWVTFPGGYFVAQAACVPLIVRVAGHDTTVQMGIGKPCPGQHMPRVPSS